MSVELPPLPEPLEWMDPLSIAYALWADQMRDYALAALSAREQETETEFADCKKAYELLFKLNAKLQAQLEAQKPLTDEQMHDAQAKSIAMMSVDRHLSWLKAITRAIEHAHGIGEKQ